MTTIQNRWWRTPLLHRFTRLQQREDQIFLALALVSGALTGVAVDAPVLGSVVLASATSWMVLRLLLGNSPLFKLPQYALVNAAEFGVYALGIASGLVSVAFSQLLLRLRARFLRRGCSTS